MLGSCRFRSLGLSPPVSSSCVSSWTSPLTTTSRLSPLPVPQLTPFGLPCPSLPGLWQEPSDHRLLSHLPLCLLSCVIVGGSQSWAGSVSG